MARAVPEIAAMEPRRRGEVARLLTRAFASDPMMTHALPDEAQRARRMPRMMGMSIRHGERYGRVRVARGSMGEAAGAAIWLAPGTTDVTFGRMIRSGMLLMPAQLGPAAFGRMMQVTAPMESAHKRLMPGRHWYLFILGSDPDHRGSGAGTALVTEGCGWADAERLPIYLETQNERNLGWYARFGFAVAEEIPSPGPTSWALIRPPSAGDPQTDRL